MAKKVRTPEAWLAEHAPHGQHTIEPAPHPSDEWVWWVCPCGAMYMTLAARKIPEKP